LTTSIPSANTARLCAQVDQTAVRSLIARISQNFDKKGLLELGNAWAASYGGNPVLVYANGVPCYYIVPIIKDNECISEMAIDAKSGDWMWYSETYSFAKFPPVSEEQAEMAACGYEKENLPAGSLGEPRLTMMPDECLYWAFPVLKEGTLLGRVCVSFTSPKIVLSEGEILKAENSSRNEPGVSMAATELHSSDSSSVSAPDPTLKVPYHPQLKKYYCSDAALEMVFNYYGADVSQYEIADVARTYYGTYEDDMRRAAQFSNLSTSVGTDNPTGNCTGYAERAVGYAAFEYAPGTPWLNSLESLIDKGYPIVVETWYNTTHPYGHTRVVTGYDNSIGAVIVNDPWNNVTWGRAYGGPNVVFNSSTFEDLWSYSGYWGLFTHPWVVTLNVPSSVVHNSTFSVNASVTYPCPSPFDSSQYPASSPNATIRLPAGLSLTSGETATQTLGTGTIGSGGGGGSPHELSANTLTARWQVVAGNSPGTYEISVSADGIISGNVSAHSPYSAYSYSDRIGGTGEGNTSIIASPSAVITPSSATMDIGEFQTFNSTVFGGISPYSCQWYLDRSAVPGANTSSWTYFPSSIGPHAICLNVTDSASTPVTATSNTVNVTVNSAPSVDVLPAYATIRVGEPQVFTSSVSGGTSPYSYKWYLNGSIVSNATGASWTFTPSSTGSYNISVTVNDTVGAIATSTTSTLTVLPAVPEFPAVIPLTLTLSALSVLILILTKRRKPTIDSVR
jgi:hypothetical protein